MANYYYAASDGNIRMQNLYLFPGGGSLQLSKSRGYYAEKTEQNQNGYESGEEALRRLELREDWSAAVNSAIGGGAKPSSAEQTAIRHTRFPDWIKTMTEIRMTAAAAGITVMRGMTGENRNRRRITIKANPKAEKTMCCRRLRFFCR